MEENDGGPGFAFTENSTSTNRKTNVQKSQYKVSNMPMSNPIQRFEKFEIWKEEKLKPSVHVYFEQDMLSLAQISNSGTAIIVIINEKQLELLQLFTPMENQLCDDDKTYRSGINLMVAEDYKCWWWWWYECEIEAGGDNRENWWCGGGECILKTVVGSAYRHSSTVAGVLCLP